MPGVSTIDSSTDSADSTYSAPPWRGDGAQRIELRLRDAGQLFNTMRAPPLLEIEKYIGGDAGEFIVIQQPGACRGCLDRGRLRTNTLSHIGNRPELAQSKERPCPICFRQLALAM